MSKEYIKAQTPLPAYFPYPKFLLQMSLSHTARLTYVLLLDRMTLSQKNGWVDVQGRAYVLYPLAGLAEDLQSSISSVTRALRELEAARLIERRSNGFSKPNQVLLSFPSTAQKCTVEMVKNEQPDCSKVSNTIAQNCTPNQINKNNLRWNKINRTKEAYIFMISSLTLYVRALTCRDVCEQHFQKWYSSRGLFLYLMHQPMLYIQEKKN